LPNHTRTSRCKDRASAPQENGDLMHHDQQIENDQDLDDDENDATDVKNHCAG